MMYVYECITVKPVLSGPLMRRNPVLRGNVLRSRKFIIVSADLYDST